MYIKFKQIISNIFNLRDCVNFREKYGVLENIDNFKYNNLYVPVFIDNYVEK